MIDELIINLVSTAFPLKVGKVLGTRLISHHFSRTRLRSSDSVELF